MPGCAGTVAVAEERESGREIPSTPTKVRGRKISRCGKPYLDSAERDNAAIGQIQNGDREGLVHLFERYSRPVLRLATRILRDPADAQEVLQEVFLYIHKRSCIFDPAKGSVGSWVLQQAHSRSLNRWNQKHSGVYGGGVAIETIRGLADPEGGPHRLVERLTARQIVCPLLGQLTHDQRETLRLYFVDGYTLREIGEIRKQGERNSRHHYYRGIEKLRRILAEGSRLVGAEASQDNGRLPTVP